ncbi:MAG: helix-turn-helix domain-containing protein [Pseudomonadota bacterium]
MRDPKRFTCPVEATLDVIGGKWKSIILYYLFEEGVHRFVELRRKIPGISERMLTQQLRELAKDDIVRRQAYAEVPPRVEYSLTEYGLTLASVSEALCDWGEAHIERLKQAEAQ